ncbi:P-loop containing nucleoside triphosphate hydrolase protein [Epithele typhae]|uniref:P-loop containing nucleoside triphosphate hydrolase protein n=1 Tax=Epithele typhae TaxID=378194 RepID=UPI002007D2DD|nr:P-loop containing nucleoside triphosphate hydrolase protein [Epithele typhae]KAH9928519.1 P-loop containing nucleoside triphosphate hydrolase protein [Epithele typhae]
MAALEFGLPSLLLPAPAPDAPQDPTASDVDAFMPTGLLFQDSTATSREQAKCLLLKPIHKMLDDISATTAAQLARECVSFPRIHLHTHPLCREQEQLHRLKLSTTTNTALWVDQYRPKRFTELVGDERVHREVLSWVKEWDHCVFGKNKNRSRKRARGDDDENLDQLRRPREKVSTRFVRLLLLSGPPVAQHAGYTVFELNASDSRSGNIIETHIRPAVEIGTKIGSSKPNLVVIDEIDGATGSAEAVSAIFSHGSRSGLRSGRGREAGGTPQHSAPLRRPIICICNDLYASSLAQLRQHARIVRFSRPHDTHVIEKMKADSRALATLVGVAQGDFRGCLNTLQMLKARNDEVTESVVRDATRGMKQTERSQVDILNDLFTPLSRKRAKELGISEEETRYVERLSREVEGVETDKLTYLNGIRWLCTWDSMMGSIRMDREYALLPYLPYTLVAFYPLFQERGGPKVERPKADWEYCYTQTKTNEEIYRSLADCLRTAATHTSGAYRHLAPPRQVIKPAERAVLARLVSLMSAVGLRFLLERTEEGALVYRLEPAIDVFVTYEGRRAADIALVAAEIDAQVIARNAEATEKGAGSKSSAFFGKSNADAQPAPKRQKKDDTPVEKAAVDFFGRPIVPKDAPTEGSQARGGAKVTPYRVAYKFYEGNSAAVRRPVKVSAFL